MRRIVMMLIVAAVLTAACDGSGADGVPPRAATLAPAQATGQPAADAREIAVTIAGFRYAPQDIEARPGERVRFTVTNRDSVPHTLTFRTAAGSYSVPVAGGEARAGAALTLDAMGNLAVTCQIHPATSAAIITGRAPGGTAPAVPGTPAAGSGDYAY